MQLYELLFIIVPHITDDEVPKTIEAIVAVMQKKEEKLVIKEKKSLGRRKFTYAIKHLTEGTYVLIDFESDSALLQEINRILELEDDILRHIIVKKEIKSPKQIEKEEKLKEEMRQARITDSRDKDKKPTEKLVQKTEELPKEKGEAAASVENLDEKLDEILKKEIV